MWLVILSLFLLLLYFILGGNATILGKQGKSTYVSKRLDFYTNGMDSGFSFSEINLLWSASKRINLESPLRIFGSMAELDKIIGEISFGDNISPSSGISPESVLLKKLLEYRNKLELDKSRNRSGIKSTRTIAVGHKLHIRLENGAIYNSQIIANEAEYLTISIPVGDPLPAHFSWRTRTLNIYLCKENDAGYFFQSHVIKGYYNLDKLHFRIHHSEKVLRRQRRESIRRKVSIPAILHTVDSIDDANQLVESNQGQDCVMESLSTGGASIRIQERIKARQIIKLEFRLRKEHLIIPGVVLRYKHQKKTDEEICNIEFLPYNRDNGMDILWYIMAPNKTLDNNEKSLQDDNSVNEYALGDPDYLQNPEDPNSIPLYKQTENPQIHSHTEVQLQTDQYSNLEKPKNREEIENLEEVEDAGTIGELEEL